MEYTADQVRYWTDSFQSYRPFDIIPYQEVVDRYMNNHSTLNSTYERFGDNERPINSDKEELKDGEFWNGFPPVYHNIGADQGGFTMAKADVISMDMTGLGERWSHFMYLVLPKDFINTYMTNLHDNDDVSVIRKFIDEVESTPEGWETSNWKKIEEKYDKLYPAVSEYTDYYETHTCIKWKQDFDILQYISLKTKGLLYPICYNSPFFILGRGTHRAVLLAKSGSDVPIFVQFPSLDLKYKEEYIIKTPLFFKGSELEIRVNLEKKKLTFFIDNKEVGFTKS